MEKKEVLANLVDAKKAAVLRVVLNSQDELYLKEISQKSSVPMSSAFRILQGLVKAGVLERREWKTSKVYSCKKETKNFLKELFTEDSPAVQDFLQALKPIPGIENIFLHSDKRGKNMVLIVGKNLPSELIERIAAQIRENGQDINCLALARDQYEQMLRMGLYPQEKKVLR
ncbi:helix-turn-helix domain-containing protein [Candidatus Woesearchaeota archaeon]|nr:helix-turn-helix domain-containing protein [Candidatus Woesearchaeota archaeon]